MALLRKRNQRASAFSAWTERDRSRTASTTTSLMATSRQSGATRAPAPRRMCTSNSRLMSRAVVYLRWRPGNRRRTPCRSMWTRCSRAGMQRPTSSMRHCSTTSPIADARLVQRQALAGMLWSKQYYQFDVTRWHGRRPRPTDAAASTQARPQRGLAAHVQRATSCRCPTSGNTRGTRRGTSRFMRPRSR